MIALAFAETAILVASASGAEAGVRTPGVGASSSYGFDDSLLINGSVERPRTLSPFAGEGALRCLVACGPAFGTYVVRRSELLSTNAADLSVNKAIDSTGHAMGISGMVMIERLEPEGFGADLGFPADWVVVGERTLDSGGTHSWSLLSSEISHLFPIDIYRFDGSSVSTDFVAGEPTRAGATPEASTWAMMLIGFAGLGRPISKLREPAVLKPHAQRMACLMYSLRQRRSARSGSTTAPIRRSSQVLENRDVKTEPARDAADELAAKLPILEPEALGLRQLLAEVKANRDDLRRELDGLRRDRDRRQKLAEQAGRIDAGRRAWFCGRVSSRA